MRPQRPATASSGANRPSPYAETRPPPADGKARNGSSKQVHINASNKNSSEIASLQDQLRAVLQRQSEVEAQHQRDVTAYRHHLRRMYNDNAVLRNIINAAENRRRNDDRLTTAATPGGVAVASSVTEAECENLQLRINLAARKLNKVQHDLAEEESIVRRNKEAEAKAKAQLRAPLEKDLFAGGNASVFLRTQRMERRLDAVLLQQSAVSVVLRGYEHHLHELTESGRHFEGHMQCVDSEFAARHRDHVQLTILFANAEEDYSKVCEAREALLSAMSRLRTAKEHALAEKSNEVSAALRETQRREQHLTDVQQQLEEEVQQLEYTEHVRRQLDQRRYLSRAVNDIAPDPSSAADAEGNGSLLESGDALTAEEGEKLAAYEKAFRAMMQAAHVDRLEDLVTAFEDEHASRGHLADQVAEVRRKHEKLSEEVKRLRRRREDAGGVFSGANTLNNYGSNPIASSSSKLLAELHTFVREEQTALRRRIAANEAAEALLLEIARRVDAITAKVSAYRPDIYIPPSAEQDLLVAEELATNSMHTDATTTTRRSVRAVRQGWTSLLGHVSVLKMKLFALADDAIQATAAAAAVAQTHALDPYTLEGKDSASAATTPVAAATAPVARSTQVVIPENNLRVRFEKKPIAASIAYPKSYLQLHQRQGGGMWMGGSSGPGSAGGRERTGPRDSILTDYEDDADDGALLLLSDAAAAAADDDDDGADPLAATGSSSSDNEGTQRLGRDDDAKGVSTAAGKEGEATAANAGSASAAGGNAEADGFGSQWKSRSDDPLDRAEVKKMSAVIQLRERRRLERERRNPIGGH